MDDIFVYCVKLPPGINEMVTPCCDGYTVYINIGLDLWQRRQALRHAIDHIIGKDFNGGNVQKIERGRHAKR